jgi:hypothetical protein
MGGRLGSAPLAPLRRWALGSCMGSAPLAPLRRWALGGRTGSAPLAPLRRWALGAAWARRPFAARPRVVGGARGVAASVACLIRSAADPCGGSEDLGGHSAGLRARRAHPPRLGAGCWAWGCFVWAGLAPGSGSHGGAWARRLWRRCAGGPLGAARSRRLWRLVQAARGGLGGPARTRRRFAPKARDPTMAGEARPTYRREAGEPARFPSRSGLRRRCDFGPARTRRRNAPKARNPIDGGRSPPYPPTRGRSARVVSGPIAAWRRMRFGPARTRTWN